MRFRPIGLLLACACAAALCAAPALASRHVIVVSLDGLRPDVALRANMPAFRALMRRGAFTMYATTTDVAITLPSHTSMLTGVPPEQHGITYNADPRPVDRPAPEWPTLFEVAHQAGLSTAMAVGKSKFSVLCPAGALDTSFVPVRGSVYSDSAVAATAARWIATRRPQVLFVHLPGLDAIGHAKGWGSEEQVAGAEAVDRAFAAVLRAVAHAGLTDSTLVIVSADHGGAGKTHGGLDARSRLIPWIAAGPGVKHDFDLALLPATQVRTEDTFATAAAWMGITLEKPVVGRSVDEVFEGR
ncbi:MAG: alkaline phosphatase family protein [Candidatus Eisenbacteria bacterium]|uniref:Alkaline phosphatase family protein n=1 Tax=Eiseniibacteriota bacterium TaxID=2212470 RepID=A0A933W9I6_UNCEI|nr:alkaline phosphatase family protein [Candidatus Eisenbacteria bacterium]